LCFVTGFSEELGGRSRNWSW